MRTFSLLLRVSVLVLIAGVLLFALFFAPDLATGRMHVLTRSDCLLHRPWLILTFAVSDGVIWLCFWYTPLTFIRLMFDKIAQVKHNIAASISFWLALFIALCGLNHLFDLLSLKYPIYGVFAYIKVSLALVSAYIALFVLRKIESMIVMPRGLLEQASTDLHALINQPARSVQEYRALLRRSTEIIDSIVEPGSQGEK